MKDRLIAVAAVLCALTCWSASLLAQERPEHREHERGREAVVGHAPGVVHAPVELRPPRLQLDQRYDHNHYYPPRGYAVPVLPSGSLGIGYGGGNWFFHGGVWFRPLGGRFIVSVPPIGITVPLLPPSYATLWLAGVAYYYANGVYYAQAPGQAGYVVVDPPPGAAAAQPVPAAPPPKALPEPIVYPRNGQTAAQTEADRQDCNRWATTQPNAMADASVFQRSAAACMDGRGYTVR